MLSPLPLSSFGIERSAALSVARLRIVADVAGLGLHDLVELREQSPSVYAGIAEVGARLCEGLEAEQEEVSLEPSFSQSGPRFGEFELGIIEGKPSRFGSQNPQFGSVEVEEKLQQALLKLQRAPQLALIGSNKLGAYWNREKFGSAPFEEVLSLQQLSAFKARTLLEKKTFSLTKASGMIAAIEAALTDTQGQAPAVFEVAPAVAHSAQMPNSNASIKYVQVSWGSLDPALKPSSAALLRLFEQQVSSSPSDSAFRRFLAALPGKVSALEFLALWFEQETDSDVLTRWLKIEPAALGDLIESASTKVNELFTLEAPELRSYWEIALRSPGIELDKLKDVLGDSGLDSHFLTGILRLVLSAIGARHPIAYGVDLSKYWTRNPSAFQIALSGILSSLPKSAEAVAQDFTAMFPFIDIVVLTEVLKRQAHFLERDQKWVKRVE